MLMLEFYDKEEARDDLLLFRYSVIGFDSCEENKHRLHKHIST